jgi:hypothetical protein
LITFKHFSFKRFFIGFKKMTTTYAYPPGLVSRLRHDEDYEAPTEMSAYDPNQNYYRAKITANNYPTNDPGWNLLKAIGQGNKGVSYNSFLTTEKTARDYLDNLKNKDPKYSGWGIRKEDLDQDPNTPDDVIIHDSQGNPIVVSGYRITSGAGRRKAAILYNQYPTRRSAAHVRAAVKRENQQRLFNRWLSEQSKHARNIQPYSEQWLDTWVGNHPKDDPDYYTQPENMKVYARVSKLVHSTLGSNPETKQGPNREFYMEIARLIISEIYANVKNSGGDTENTRHAFITSNLNAIRQSIVNSYQQHIAYLLNTYGGQVPMPHIYKKKAMSRE